MALEHGSQRIKPMKNDILRAAIAEAEAWGLTVSTVRERNHRVLRLATGTHSARLLVVSRSCSDGRRGLLNIRADIRRLARELRASGPTRRSGSGFKSNLTCSFQGLTISRGLTGNQSQFIKESVRSGLAAISASIGR